MYCTSIFRDDDGNNKDWYKSYLITIDEHACVSTKERLSNTDAGY